jgi:metallo-beta-lactamase family protein
VDYPIVIHHGGVESITGSCHQLKCNESHSLLIDCGLRLDSTASDVFDVPLNTIKALVLTHVHVDLVGRVPDLLAAGYSGPIICSEPSASMLPLTLEDAYKHQFAHNEKDMARYLAIIQERTIALPFNQWHVLVENPELVVRIRLQRAGHILGSAYVECDVQYPEEQRDKRVVFSGDLGSKHNPLLYS